jgi:hypothetical protein
VCPACNAAVPVRQPAPGPKLDICADCGNAKDKNLWTCPHCGHTQWGDIAMVGSIGVGCLVAAALGSQIGEPLWRNVVMGGGAIIGVLFTALAVGETFSGVIKLGPRQAARRQKRQQSQQYQPPPQAPYPQAPQAPYPPAQAPYPGQPYQQPPYPPASYPQAPQPGPPPQQPNQPVQPSQYGSPVDDPWDQRKRD